MVRPSHMSLEPQHPPQGAEVHGAADVRWSLPGFDDGCFLTIAGSMNSHHRPAVSDITLPEPGDPSPPVFVSAHPLLQAIMERAALVAKTQAAVLITGESGTGKEVIARYIHEHSGKTDKPCVAINCAALPRDVIDNELFGHEKEAFTGAVTKKAGCFELAHGGTLFLDEVAEMHPQVQAKLLRALELKRFRRLGGHEEIEVDVRIVAATNRNIADALASGDLREDVYYRLGVVEIALPPLRDRRSDVPLLIDYFMERFSQTYSKPRKVLSPESLEILEDYHWPGNVRELRNLVESLIITCPEDVVEPVHLPERMSREHALKMAISIPVGSSIQAVEQLLIEHTLRASGGNKSRTAKILGVSRKYLYEKLRTYGKKGKGTRTE
jgi:DNA-binding NtrC family response regulator